MGRVKAKFEMSVFDVLVNEHRDVEALFDQIEATHAESPDQARDLFMVLYESLLAHAKAEQEVVYARLAELEELADKIEEATDEHATIEALLQELRAGPTGDRWLMRLGELQQIVEHHVQEEEDVVFSKAHAHLEEDEGRELAASYLQAKARRTGQPEAEQARERTPPTRSEHPRRNAPFR